MMEKIYMERVVRAPEIQEFEKSLRPHQMALTAEGLTVLQKAMIEHNLFVDANGSIDQIDVMIYFIQVRLGG